MTRSYEFRVRILQSVSERHVRVYKYSSATDAIHHTAAAPRERIMQSMEELRDAQRRADKLTRIPIFNDTLRYFREFSIDFFSRTAHANSLRWQREAALRLAANRKLAKRGITLYVEEMDCLRMAKCLSVLYGTDVAVLNFANAFWPGGGVKSGAGAQEENIFRRFSCYLSIQPRHLTPNGQKYNQHTAAVMEGLGDRVYIDMRKKRVCIRDQEDDKLQNLGYEFIPLPEIFEFIELRAAALNLGDPNVHKAYSVRGAFEKECNRRIRAQFLTLKENGVRHVVLGAFGCGAFLNNPGIVARTYVRAIKEFVNDFDVIAFPIIMSAENLQVFRKTFQDVNFPMTPLANDLQAHGITYPSLFKTQHACNWHSACQAAKSAMYSPLVPYAAPAPYHPQGSQPPPQPPLRHPPASQPPPQQPVVISLISPDNSPRGQSGAAWPGALDAMAAAFAQPQRGHAVVSPPGVAGGGGGASAYVANGAAGGAGGAAGGGGAYVSSGSDWGLLPVPVVELLMKGPPPVVAVPMHWLNEHQAAVIREQKLLPLLKYIPRLPCWVPSSVIADAFNRSHDSIQKILSSNNGTPFLWATEFELQRKSWKFVEPTVQMPTKARVHASAMEYFKFQKEACLRLQGPVRWQEAKGQILWQALQARFKNPYLRWLLVQTHPHPLVSMNPSTIVEDSPGITNLFQDLLMRLRGHLVQGLPSQAYQQ